VLLKNLTIKREGSPDKTAKEVGEMSAPIKKFSSGGIEVAIWENESGKGNKFNTVSLQRSYKDKDDEWKSTGSLRTGDIPKAILTLQKAYEYLSLKESEEKQEIALALT
tara:strand:+ start:1241 stop:1567 length:327 start_codon:yes stop_codon:yes gene_type:complete